MTFRAPTIGGGTAAATRPRFAGRLLLLSLILAARPARAQEPGVDVAAPRFAISTVDDVTFEFHPARLVVEQGDWVRWTHTSVAAFPLFHTTTSGVNCAAGGLWNAPLLPPSSPGFTRRFLEPPQVLPYFCSPHCIPGGGMVGQVVVTDTILMLAGDSAGTTRLAWAGGGGTYRVFRSGDPGFPAEATQVLSPDGGSQGTTFTDPARPGPGGAFFYLAMNLF